MALGGLVLGSLILYLKGMRLMMFQLSGFYCKGIYKGSFTGIYTGSFKGIYKGAFTRIYKGSIKGRDR